MARCEDYPCCGHGASGDGGACPDKSGRFPCVECGAKLPKTATSSICKACMRGALARMAYDGHGGYDSDY